MRPTTAALPKEAKQPVGSIKHQPTLPANTSGNRQHLIQFMRKLTDHIISNRVVQLSVFESLNHDDLQMLFQSISDQNEQLRKSAAKFICYLLYDNEKIQQFLIDRQHLCNSEGKVQEKSSIVSSELAAEQAVPRRSSGYSIGQMRELLKALEDIPEVWDEKYGESPLCWVLDIDSRKFRWLSWEEQSKQPGFIDPFVCLFGIVRQHRSPASRRLLNKFQKDLLRTISTANRAQQVPTKPEYLDRLLKRKSVREK